MQLISTEAQSSWSAFGRRYPSDRDHNNRADPEKLQLLLFYSATVPVQELQESEKSPSVEFYHSITNTDWCITLWLNSTLGTYLVSYLSISHSQLAVTVGLTWLPISIGRSSWPYLFGRAWLTAIPMFQMKDVNKGHWRRRNLEAGYDVSVWLLECSRCNRTHSEPSYCQSHLEILQRVPHIRRCHRSRRQIWC